MTAARRLAGFVLALVPAVAAAEGPAIQRADAKAYSILKRTRRFPPLERGEAERTLAADAWTPSADRADDPRFTGRNANRQLLEASCGADLVVVARATPFRHPDDRWVLTAHDLVVSRVVRTRSPRTARPDRLRYVHPSGALTVAGRTVRTAVDRFPAIESDEDALFFLVRIAGTRYRTSLVVPPMALRGGVLDGLGTAGPRAEPEPAAGFGIREAMRLAADAICRPAPGERRSTPGGRDGRLPPFSGPPPP